MTGRDVALPADYAWLLEQPKTDVRDARVRAHQVVNSEVLRLCWTIGAAIREQQNAEGWGHQGHWPSRRRPARGIPGHEVTCRDRTLLMRAFAACWDYPAATVRQPAGLLPLGHTRRRAIVRLAFSPRRVARLDDAIGEITQPLVDAVARAGDTTELVASYAAVLPMRMITEAVGAGQDDTDQVRRWSDAFIAHIGRDVPVGAENVIRGPERPVSGSAAGRG